MTPFGSLLHEAVDHGELKIAQWLIKMGVNINERAGLADATPLHTAATEGQLGAVQLLLDHQAEFDVSDPKRDQLFGAIYGGHLDVVKLLVEHGFDTSVKYTRETMHEANALAYAERQGQAEIADYLRSIGNETSKTETTPPSEVG